MRVYIEEDIISERQLLMALTKFHFCFVVFSMRQDQINSELFSVCLHACTLLPPLFSTR
jgi:hypothetical protein